MSAPAQLTKRDFQTDQDVRWCPGCGDYAILSTVQKVFPSLGIPRENFAIVSGIGCAARFPYYMNTYGFHSIHGRAPAIATGVKLANPELSVWVVSGDGDALSIGGNHLIHALRRNIDLKILLFNNRIYGLTKGQTSPTSEFGKRTKSTPQGSIDRPVNPIALALGAGATFVARTIDVQADHMSQVLERAAAHKGTALIEILQNCNIFNNGAFLHITDRSVRDERQLVLEHGKPLRFGANLEKGIKLNRSLEPEVVTLGEGADESDLLVHNEGNATAYQHLLAELGEEPLPVPIGVFRAIDAPTYDIEADAQITKARPGGTAPSDEDLQALVAGGETWTV